MARAHLEALSSRHAMIEGQIAMELSRPLPDTVHLTRLKRQKLKVKEQLARKD